MLRSKAFTVYCLVNSKTSEFIAWMSFRVLAFIKVLNPKYKTLHQLTPELFCTERETAHHQIHNLNTSWEVYCLPCCIDPHGLGLHHVCHYYKNLLQLNYKLLLLLTQYSTVAYSWQHFKTKGKKKSRMEKLICTLPLHRENVNYLLNMKSVKLLKNSFLGRSHRSMWTNLNAYFVLFKA